MYGYSADRTGFTDIRKMIPDAVLDIRYHTENNFIGEKVDGYERPLAFLTYEAAEALKEAAVEFRKDGYLLRIYDAYRPQCAVDHFLRWANDPEDVRMKEEYYPDIDKDVIIPKGYIAEHSSHSRGSTVDLSLCDPETGKELDMGGHFDLFGELSHPSYRGISDEQYRNRQYLKEVMERHGFLGIEEEWWHFTLKDEPYPETYFTFTVDDKEVIQ